MLRPCASSKSTVCCSPVSSIVTRTASLARLGSTIRSGVRSASTIRRSPPPAAARERLARCCEVFCEPGVFTVPESRQILTAARRHGFAVKLHADELEGSGGAELAVELGALSADHLAAISDQGIRALSTSTTVAVLLPATMIFLGRRTQAPGRRLIDAGAAVALATDFNPGTSPTVSLPR